MTPEALEKLVLKGKPKQVHKAVLDLDDATRKKLSPAMKKIKQRVRTGDGLVTGRMDWEKEDHVRRKWAKINKHILTNCDLATLAIGPAADAHRVRMYWGEMRDFRNHVVDILIRRNPGWLDTWVDRKLSGEFPELDFDTVRRLYEAGAIDKPTSDNYTRLFVSELNSYDWQKPETYVPASERLLEKPDYLEEDIWRLFDCENQALVTDYTERSSHGPKNYEPWRVVVSKLIDRGLMDRDRTLDATLSALDNEFKQNYLSGLAKLHEFLKPSADEMKAREARYVELLSNPTGPVVSFAVRMLSKLQRAKRLDTALYLSSAAPVFGQKAKGTGVQSLKIAAGLLSADASLRPAVVSFAISGMAHPSPDVQVLALELIGDGIRAADDKTRKRFERQAANLTAKLQPRAYELLGKAVAEAPPPPVDTSRFAADIEALPDDVRALTGLSGDGAASRMPAPLDYSLLNLPRLPGAYPFTPLETVEQLLEHAAHVVEIVDSVDQVEQLLDGIARLGCRRNGNFAKLAAPITQRIESGSGGSSYGLGSAWGGMPLAMVDLVLTWLTGKPYRTPQNQWYGEPPPTWICSMSRLREIQNMLIERRPAQLLSTPSYTGGWIEPMHLVQRVADHLKNGHKVYAADLMYALLRLAPTGRTEALVAAADLGEVEGRIVRFALGGDDMPGKKDKRHAGVWLCAGRARDPFGSLRELLDAIADQIPDLPNHLDPADYRWTAATEVTKEGYKIRRMKFGDLSLEQIAEARKTGFVDRIARKMKGKMRWERWPIGAMHTTPEYSWGSVYEMSAPWRIDWFAMQWPLNPEPALQYGCVMLEQRLDENTSRDAPGHVFLNALFEPARCWGEMAHLALCLGLTSKSTDARGHAIDAVIPGIESGHADPLKVVDVLSRLLTGEMLKMNRLAMTLPQVLDASPLHKWWVATVVCGVIARSEKPPRNGHFLYELALDGLTPIGCTVPEDAMVTLRKLKGSSKAAKLGKELLGLDGTPLDQPPESVIAEALRGRVDFARSLA